ncbi:MAG: LPS export ABC transporter periplasmic protein LptC [Rhodospirillales bacterium]|nr:LPS export ABC transporter periplasmic protein LptC [Rhodospirillales bacterium]
MDDIPENKNKKGAGAKPVKFSQLTRDNNERTPEDVQRHSAFIRRMRIALPLIALAITAIVFSWNFLSPDDIAPAKPQAQSARTIGKNELLNPQFESIDDKGQPYTITATRALQDTDDALMLLEEPMADILLKNGNWLALSARQGAYRQETQRLLLKDNVTLFHDAGYKVKTQELDADMNTGTAQTDTGISGHGPLGTLDAKGMRADSQKQTLIFTGPARLVIYDAGAPSGTELLSP